MGFCIFNNIAIGARYAARRYGVERILIADWDVHHGNGTQEVFWSDGSVLFFDTHQHPWYPGTGSPRETGEGKGRGLIVNRPFPAGAGRNEILDAFRTELVPAAERFKPELVMISAGFDSRAGDPLGQFTLTDPDFADLTALVAEIARQHARGRRRLGARGRLRARRRRACCRRPRRPPQRLIQGPSRCSSVDAANARGHSCRSACCDAV